METCNYHSEWTNIQIQISETKSSETQYIVLLWLEVDSNICK